MMDKLFLGINNHVVCISKQSGQELWKTKVKSSSITNVYYEEGFIFAYSGGHLFCLNAQDGDIVWENPLKGMGYGTCIIASELQSTTIIASQAATQQQSSAAATMVIAGSAATSSGGDCG